MIKYLELTAPQDELFRQAKIVSIEVSEGEQVYKGSTLFQVSVWTKEIRPALDSRGQVVFLSSNRHLEQGTAFKNLFAF